MRQDLEDTGNTVSKQAALCSVLEANAKGEACQ